MPDTTDGRLLLQYQSPMPRGRFVFEGRHLLILAGVAFVATAFLRHSCLCRWHPWTIAEMAGTGLTVGLVGRWSAGRLWQDRHRAPIRAAVFGASIVASTASFFVAWASVHGQQRFPVFSADTRFWQALVTMGVTVIAVTLFGIGHAVLARAASAPSARSSPGP